MRTLNLGVLAHVDAGKTSLTERLLYAAGVIDELGRVDDGNTQTDSLALERRRGITIRSAVVSFVVDGVTVNLIDTPGHPDFIAEVDRVLGVLDGAVLVVSPRCTPSGSARQPPVPASTCSRRASPLCSPPRWARTTARCRARCSRSSGAPPARRSRTLACSPASCAPATGSASATSSRRSPPSACSTGARPGGRRRSRRARSPSSGASPACRSATPSARRDRRRPSGSSRRPRSRPSSCRPVPGGRGRCTPSSSSSPSRTPFIALRQDDTRGELFVSLYGEVQKQVLRATLADDYGIDVEFRETTILCVERPVSTGRALEVRGRGGNPFAATVGLRIEPGPAGSGLTVRSEVEAGSIPVAYPAAVEEKTRETLREGLYGWQVSDCTVTITHCDHRPPPVPVGGFRSLTPLVAMAALERAGTAVCEPIHRFHLDLPADTVPAARAVLARLEAVPHTQTARGSSATLEGEIRAAHVHRLRQQLLEATGGKGVLESAFVAYRAVGGPAPTRPRSGPDPRHRQEYLLHLTRRVQA